MEIQKIILTNSVTICGNNIWGNPAKITFSPAPSGWYFRNQQTGEDTPINRHTISWDTNNNVFIKHKKSEIRLFEHILLIKWFGLDGVAISGTMWPPLYTAMEYFSHLRDAGALFAIEENVKSFSIDKIYSSDDYYQKNSANFGPVGTVLVPFKEAIFKEDYSFKNIAIDVYINYSGVGELYKFYSDFLSAIYSVMAIYPYEQKDILERYNTLYQELVSTDLPDHIKIGYIRYEQNETLLRLSKNRVSSIMSTMAMIKHDALPLNFRFSSYCGRHFHDLRMTKGVSNSYA